MHFWDITVSVYTGWMDVVLPQLTPLTALLIEL